MSPEIKPYDGLSPHRRNVHVSGRVVVTPEPRDVVAICGAGGAAYMPWDDPSVECWAMNNLWNWARDSKNRLAASRWWEQHQIFPDSAGAHSGVSIQDPNDMRWIETCPVPLYTTEFYESNPNAVVWPVQYFANKYRNYFACTFAMQIIQAFDEGFKELRVYGLELLLGTQREATIESSCVNYWLGFVEGRGMEVHLVDRPSSLAVDVSQLGRIRPTEQFLLTHPYYYGHEYWKERNWVERYVDTIAGRPVAV